tara:strand:+ start:6095 stop:6433 length:339 start_codon:yes stop_codon:yes gene_type:complete
VVKEKESCSVIIFEKNIIIRSLDQKVKGTIGMGNEPSVLRLSGDVRDSRYRGKQSRQVARCFFNVQELILFFHKEQFICVVIIYRTLVTFQNNISNYSVFLGIYLFLACRKI